MNNTPPTAAELHAQMRTVQQALLAETARIAAEPWWRPWVMTACIFAAAYVVVRVLG